MITFKQPEHLDKLPATESAYATVKEIISPYIDDPTYRPLDDGYVGTVYCQDLILNALEIVSAWDITDEDFAQAVNDQAKLMAGVPPEELLEAHSETH